MKSVMVKLYKPAVESKSKFDVDEGEDWLISLTILCT